MPTIALILCAIVAALFSAPIAAEPGLVFIVRHAEKAKGDDPGLTPRGQERALFLTSLVRDDDELMLLATPYRRTRETLAPLSERFETPIAEYEPLDTVGVKATLAASDADKVFIAGHSNTINLIAEALTGESAEPVDDAEYDRIYVIHNGDLMILRSWPNPLDTQVRATQ